MTLSDEIARIDSIFIDTAPIIYYMEAHPHFGTLAKAVVDAFLTNDTKLKRVEAVNVWVLKDFL